MLGSNPHLASPCIDVGLLPCFESGVQRVHLLSLLLLLHPLTVPRREVQIFDKSEGQNGREIKRGSRTTVPTHKPEPRGVGVRLLARVHPLLRPVLTPSVVPLQDLSVSHAFTNALRSLRLDSLLLLLDLLPRVLLVLQVLLDLDECSVSLNLCS